MGGYGACYGQKKCVPYHPSEDVPRERGRTYAHRNGSCDSQLLPWPQPLATLFWVI